MDCCRSCLTTGLNMLSWSEYAKLITFCVISSKVLASTCLWALLRLVRILTSVTVSESVEINVRIRGMLGKRRNGKQNIEPFFSSADWSSTASRSGWKLGKGRTVPRVPQDMFCGNPKFSSLEWQKTAASQSTLTSVLLQDVESPFGCDWIQSISNMSCWMGEDWRVSSSTGSVRHQLTGKTPALTWLQTVPASALHGTFWLWNLSCDEI